LETFVQKIKSLAKQQVHLNFPKITFLEIYVEVDYKHGKFLFLPLYRDTVSLIYILWGVTVEYFTFYLTK